MDDDSEYGALDQKNSFCSGWMRRRYRYEEEENFPLSPPDDSSFLTLHFGSRRNKPVESMYDRINKEMGLAYENPSGPVTLETTVEHLAPSPASAQNIDSSEVIIGTKGITLDKFKSKPHVSEHIFIATGSPNHSPKLVRHPPLATDSPSHSPKFLRHSPFVSIIEQKEDKESGSDPSLEAQNKSNLAPFRLPKDPSDELENSSVAKEDLESLVEKSLQGRPTRKISSNLADSFDPSLLDSVRHLKLDVPPSEPLASAAYFKSITSGLPSVSAVSSDIDSGSSAVSGEKGSEPPRRKTSAPPSLNPMLPETQKVHNYFFTGSLFAAVTSASTPGSRIASNHDLTASSSSIDRLDLSSKGGSARDSPLRESESSRGNSPGISGLAQMTSQMEKKTHEASALEPKLRLGKRRPRASALREMNFWAPQSS